MKRTVALVQLMSLFLLGLVVSVIVIRWLMREREEIEEAAIRISARRPTDVHIPIPMPPAEEPRSARAAPSDTKKPAAEKSARPAVDDLLLIDGIGPVYARALHAIGIETYQQLSKQDADKLAERLRDQGVRIIGDRIRSEDWIGQAKRLAAS